MNLAITGRHLDITDALREQLLGKLGRLDRYKLEFITANAVASVERGRHRLEINLRNRDGFTFTTDVVSGDMYANIDLGIEKLEKQIRKYKEKSRSHLARSKQQAEQRTASRTVFSLELPDAEEKPEPAGDAPDQTIIFEEKIDLLPMSVNEAILQMETIDRAFWLFLNEDYRLSVIYKRRDGQYGLIVPEL